MSFRVLALVAALVVGSCHARGIYDPVSKPLDKALFYVEKPTYGKVRDRLISADTGTTPTQVPNPALVDMDSQILVRVDRNQIAGGSDGRFLQSEGAELLAKKDLIVRALAALDKFLEVRKETVLAYSSTDRAAFRALKVTFGEQEDQLVEQLKGIFPKDTPDGIALRNAANEERAQPYVAVRRFLREKIDDLESRYRAIEAEAKSRRVALQMIAFLDRDGQAPIAIHLEGYDTLPEGKLESRDRWGLDLSADEMARLKAQFDASVEIAAAAEKVRKGEESLKDALGAVMPHLAPQFADLVKKVEEAAKLVDPDAMKARVKTTTDLANAFWDVAKAKASTLDQDVQATVRGLPDSFREYLEKRESALIGLANILVHAKELSARWGAVDAKNLSQLVFDSVAFAGQLRRAIAAAEDLARVAAVDARQFLKEQLSQLKGEAQEAVLGLLQTPEGEALKADLVRWGGDFDKILNLAQEVRDLVASVTRTRPETNLEVPESFKVPVEDLQDTFIDLKRTGRMPGDRVTVRATRFQGDQETGTTRASFEVQRFGWYASLSPAVVLVRPDQLAGAPNDFQFAPTLSWMHRYVPRPDETGWYAAPLRTAQPAVGIHAAFLSFPSDEEVQIGLGATVSFWEDRLQFGAGYNLMAESADDGRFYYFVGTDLVGLLQTVGIVKKK